MEVIYETVLSVKEINSVEMILLVETKTKMFLVPLENEDNFYPKEDYCYEFHLERNLSLSGVLMCNKMVTITADFILQHKDSIVLIKRKHEPFQGMLALPGGFVNEGEKPIDAAIRELQEEVNVKVDIKSLRPVMVQSKPFRDPRNKWTTAHVFTAKVDDLSSIEAGDDADSYVILPIKELFKQKLAFDHLESIEYCLWPDTKDILDADSKALHIYLQMGHSKKEALDAFIKIFNLPEMSKRYETLGKHIDEYDK